MLTFFKKKKNNEWHLTYACVVCCDVVFLSRTLVFCPSAPSCFRISRCFLAEKRINADLNLLGAFGSLLYVFRAALVDFFVALWTSFCLLWLWTDMSCSTGMGKFSWRSLSSVGKLIPTLLVFMAKDNTCATCMLLAPCRQAKKGCGDNSLSKCSDLYRIFVGTGSALGLDVATIGFMTKWTAIRGVQVCPRCWCYDRKADQKCTFWWICINNEGINDSSLNKRDRASQTWMDMWKTAFTLDWYPCSDDYGEHHRSITINDVAKVASIVAFCWSRTCRRYREGNFQLNIEYFQSLLAVTALSSLVTTCLCRRHRNRDKHPRQLNGTVHCDLLPEHFRSMYFSGWSVGCIVQSRGNATHRCYRYLHITLAWSRSGRCNTYKR